MKQLLRKELSLALHPTSLIFLLLSAMVLIPNYPYYVIFFYTGLGLFFTCLSGRENGDVLFSLLLPVSRRQVVAARILTVMLLEVCQLLFAAGFTALRYVLGMPENAAGMEAGLSLFGLSLAMLGLFHVVFFSVYYKNVQHVGRAFLWGSGTVFLFIALMETFAHTVPFFRDVLDTPDPAHLPEKLAMLAIGVLLWLLLSFVSYRRSVRLFLKQNL